MGKRCSNYNGDHQKKSEEYFQDFCRVVLILVL